jgi:hypothetical protein
MTAIETGESGSQNITERIAQWEEQVSKLRKEYEAKPTPESQKELKRKFDTLLHLKNIAKGDPGERARRAAGIARRLTLDKAIKQIA